MVYIEHKKALSIEIVEDEVSLREALVYKFTKEGFRVFQAGDGEEGLALALKEKPDIILLDILMPKMNGMMVLNKLRSENVWGKNVPVILLTNSSPDEENISEGITKDEPAYYLIKSDSSIDDVVDKVNERLKKTSNIY